MVDVEKEVDKAILAQKRWADLDNRMRDLIGSSQEYDKKILRYSIENQLRYRGNLVRFVITDEYEYYRELLKYSRDHLMLFPYHLSDFIITGMRITPFQYYLSTMTQIIEQEKSYDTLPNFTAADCLRLLGIGRNQYIDIMNDLRSTYRGFLGIGLRRSARSLLPNKPHDKVPIEPWWLVTAGYITEDDVRSMVTPLERATIDRLVSPDGMSNQILACDIDEAIIRSLYLKGLIYLDVPIYDDDYIVVPPLEGFVMNRVTGDYLENLLYKIFVSIDQNTPVSELANILEIDIRLVKNAVSMYCRLKFAYKKNIYINEAKCHPSWKSKLDEYKKMGINLSRQGTKQSKCVSDFIKELASVEHSDLGIEVTADALPSLESTYNMKELSNMLHSPSMILSSVSNTQGPLAQVVSTPRKVVLFYDSNLAAFLMMGNLSAKLKNHAVTMFEVGKLSDEWIDSLLVELSNIRDDKIEEDGFEARRYYIHALMLHRTIDFIRKDLNLNSSDTQADPDNQQAARERVGLDLIRVESLSNLDSESCERFLKKNYQLIISVAPLNQEPKMKAAVGIPHLGAGSPLINSLWFRLYIYHITGCGPNSLLLLQGYRLARLPEPFSKARTLLINHWNRDPTCISQGNALNAINEALTHSPILVQMYPIQPIGGNLINSEEKVFIPLPIVDNTIVSDVSISDKFTKPSEDLIEWQKISAVRKLNESLDLTKTCGYITLLRSAESLKLLIKDSDSCSIFGAKRVPETLDTLPMKEPDEGLECDSSKASIDEQSSKVTMEDELTLFDCQFGIPLFDKTLNQQVIDRIAGQKLGVTDS